MKHTFSVQDMPSIEGRPAVRGYNVVRSDGKNMACFYDYDRALARANLLNNMAKSRTQRPVFSEYAPSEGV